MDSQPDSLDIAKLKRFALGLDETHTSQALLNEAGSQSSSIKAQSVRVDQKYPQNRVSRQTSPRTNISKTAAAAHIVSSSNHYVNEESRGNKKSHKPLNSVSDSPVYKMSSGGSGAGDTQPISQTIYENIISREKSFMPSQDGRHVHSEAYYVDQESLQMTVKEGEQGHIDLLADFDSNKPIAANCSSDDEGLSSKEGHSSPAQFPINNIFPESQRFLETPVTSEKRQDVPNMPDTTPSLPRNPLANSLSSSGGILSLSQLFKATQAPSSPFGLPSAPESNRPSPDIPIQARPLGGAYASSPSRTPRPSLPRTHTDPFTYVSMDESQKLREKMREERRIKSADIIGSEEPIDMNFDEESSFVQRLNRQRKIHQETSARLATVTHGQSSSVSAARPSADLNNRHEQHENPLAVDDTQGPPTSSLSEEETEKEDNTETTTSQSRRIVSSTEEDKENHVGPFAHAAHKTTTAHGRLSQVLDLHNDSPLTENPPSEPNILVSENDITEITGQVINVRDSQPSPSQRSSKHIRTANFPSQPESEHIVSSYDDSSSPRKRQRRQYVTEQNGYLSPTKQRMQRRSRSVSSEPSPAFSPLHEMTSNKQQSSMHKLPEKSSSMPSLITDTPVNKVGEDTIPETSIAASSPNRTQKENLTADALSRLPPMQETEEDDDLPTPHHKRKWDSSTTMRALDDPFNRKSKIFNSSSPEKGPIRSLTEISSQPSPQGTPGDEIDYDFFSEDREFSKTIKSPSRQVPRKKLRTTKDYADAHVVSSPLRIAETSGGIDIDNSAHDEHNINEPDSPGSPSIPIITRRQRARSLRPSENMFEIEGSPRARNLTTTSRMSQVSKHRLQEVEALESSLPPASNSFTRSSQQLSSVTDSNSVRAEKPEQNRSITSTSKNSRNSPSNPSSQVQDNVMVVMPAPRTDPIIAPKQVLALWNGRKRAFYPATYLGTCGLQRCLVAFVDSGPVEVALVTVKRLELRVGDAIKVDYQNVPKVTHIIRGFSRPIKAEDLAKKDVYMYPLATDIYGYSTVILSAKQRKSIPGDGHIEESEQTVEVPIHSIYLDMILWNQLKGRSFTVDEKTEQKSTTVAQTPARGTSTPISPGSMHSRTHLTIRTSLFSGMVFAVSFVEQDARKARVTKLISENGGQILQGGFEELFEYPSNVPSVKQGESSSQNVEEEIHFRLAPGSESIGFTCLIADKHSRRAKYMQALALNLPCLSGRWIEDCVAQNRIVGWEQYLLPAGESKYLYGAIKSRIISPVSAEKAMFAKMINRRVKLLDEQSILLVLGRGKTEEKRKAYLFLAYALGATRVGRVLDLKASDAILRGHTRNNGDQHGWDWLYVDDHEEAAAEEMIMGKSGDVANGSKKRKRYSTSAESFEHQTAANENSIRVMSNEFICQSLILGEIYK